MGKDPFRAKLIPVLLSILLLTGACGMFERPKATGSSPPVIEAYFAAPVASWGGTWRLYMKASDPDGDIAAAHFFIKDQPGITYSDFEGYVYLRAAMWKSFNGYFYLQIPNYGLALPEDMTMTVQLVDAGERKSRMLELPLRIGSYGYSQQVPPGFGDVALQHIPIKIKTIYQHERW